MVTASHNPVEDNGLKLVDPDGGMLSQDWEPLCENYANAMNSDEVSPIVKDLFSKYASLSASSCAGVVIIGRDTRPHSERLSEIFRRGVEAFSSVKLFDLGVVTTPQLHFAVRYLNRNFRLDSISQESLQESIDVYFRELLSGYRELIATAGNLSSSIIIDAAYGVGTIAIRELSRRVSTLCPHVLDIDVRNPAFEGEVNEGCGAEFVQKNQMPPCGVNSDIDESKLMCSFDGDADRIVFHVFVKERWSLVDGDKIAALLSLFLAVELKEAGLSDLFSMSVVQTAYANGSSTKFLRDHNINVVMAKTGVKFLHHRASEFDIGVYFEANGHGTVLLTDRFLAALQEDASSCDMRKRLAIDRLRVRFLH